MITDAVQLYVMAGDLLGFSGNGSGYTHQTEVWPNISFVHINPTPTANPTLSSLLAHTITIPSFK